jgi:lauroyl/myristoyl acyltransferase
VIAFFHSGWDLLLAVDSGNRHCLVRAGDNWARGLGSQRVPWGGAGLKALIRRVRRGARCAAAADNFVCGGEARFFDTDLALNPAPVRFAAAARAPLVPLWPVYDHGVVRFAIGGPISAATCAERPDEALRHTRKFFEEAVRRAPAGWPRLVSFLERSPPANGARVRALVHDCG